MAQSLKQSQLIQPLICTDVISNLTHVIPGGSVTDRIGDSNKLLSRADSVSRNRQVILTSLPLAAADLLTIAGSYVLAAMVTYLFFGAEYYWGLWNNVFALCVCHMIVGSFLELFPASGMNPVRELRAQVSSIVISFVLLVALNGLLGQVTKNEIATILISFPLVVAFAPAARFCTRKLVSGLDWWGEKVIVVGSGAQGRSVYSFLNRLPQRGLKPIGIVDDDASEYWKIEKEPDFEYLGTVDELVKICRKRQCHWVIAAVAEMDESDVRHVIAHGCMIANLVVLNNRLSMPTIWVESFDAAGLTGMHIRDRLLFPFQRLLKRLSDIVLSLTLMAMFSPLFLCIALWIKARSEGPVIFSHERIGRNGKPFGALKFRTMVPNAQKHLTDFLAGNAQAREEWAKFHKLKNDPRVIPGIGQILRQTSLDELPQLWNILKGEMSLVGPRPVYTIDEIEMYAERYPLYLRVRPGLTGLWQVSGRNNTTFADKVTLDTYYSQNWSLWLDYFILLRTVRTVVFREGSY